MTDLVYKLRTKHIYGAFEIEEQRQEAADEIERLHAVTGDLTKIAAECHQAKWQFDLSEDYRPTAKVARAMIAKAFGELHRIGDMAMKMRDAQSLRQRKTKDLP